MAGSFTSTGSYSNLTRLELEQLRRADFTAGGKALTVGDSALAPEGVVGKGDPAAEPFYTGPTVNLDDDLTKKIYFATGGSRFAQTLVLSLLSSEKDPESAAKMH